MVKDIIKYNNKEYQLSTVYIEDMVTFETMIFPIENGVVSGREVYCFRTVEAGESKYKHEDIYYHPENYISDEAVAKYLREKEESFYDRYQKSLEKIYKPIGINVFDLNL